jgi:hypothetical protein
MAKRAAVKRYETAAMTFEALGVDGAGHDVVEVRTAPPAEEVAGQIRWYGPKRQFVFIPTNLGLYTGRQLCDIYDVLGRMMTARHEDTLKRRAARKK